MPLPRPTPVIDMKKIGQYSRPGVDAMNGPLPVNVGVSVPSSTSWPPYVVPVTVAELPVKVSVSEPVGRV